MSSKNNQRRLLILSGLGDPKNSKYITVYDNIISYANQLDYEEIFVQGWRGHDSFEDKGFINFEDSTSSCIALLAKVEETGFKYDVICRSYGTGVFLNACQKIQLKKIGFATLWGIPRYTAFYELFKEQIIDNIKSSKAKGVNLDRAFFESIIPYEILLSRFNQDFKINIVNGSLDNYSPIPFHNYIKECLSNTNLNYSVINGLRHEVVEYHQEYLMKLFNQ